MREKAKKFPWFLAAVLLICLWPVYGQRARNYRPLIGVGSAAQLPAADAGSLLDGSWQEAFNTWWPENIPGRSFLVRLRNEFVYTVLRTSSNKNVAIGRRGVLYEAGLFNAYCGYPQQPSPEELTGAVQKLERLDALLAEHGKSLYIFLTPCKMRFTPEEDWPWYGNAGLHRTDPYEQFTAALRATDLKVFDGIAFLQQDPDLLPARYFYPTALHWDPCWGTAAAIGLLDQMRQTGPYDLGTMTLQAEKTTHVVTPNADLEDLLNRMSDPAFENYQPIVATAPGQDRPGLFVRTSSFGFTSLKALTDSDLFGPTVYFENQKFIARGADGTVTEAAVTAYEEMDLQPWLAQSDIVVIELMEQQYPDLAFGFVDWLLDAPQLLG